MSARTVAVIGGGVSGLSAAEAIVRHSEEAGQPTRVIVLEGEAAPGGKIQTRVDDGFVIETGPHGFLDKEPKMFELIDRLGIRDQLVAANTASARRFVVRAGRLRELPGSPLSLVTSDILPLTAKLRAAMEPFMPGPSVEDESVRDFAARRIGAHAADVLVDAMVTGIYGGDPRRLSLKAAFPRMFELERDHGSLVKAQMAIAKARRAKRQLAAGEEAAPEPKSNGTGAPVGTLHSFRHGLGTLIDALASRLEVRCQSSVDRIERKDAGGFIVHACGETLHADAVVSTVPAYVTERLLSPLHSGLAETVGKVPYVACSVVVQAFRREDVGRSTDGFGFLIPGGEQRDVLGSIWASTVFPDHSPDGIVMFRSMMGGARRPDLGRASPEVLAEKARAELAHWMAVKPAAEPVLETVIPWTKAIPQYEVGHAARVSAADAVEREVPGFFVGGNAFRGVAVLSCVAEGDAVGKRVLRSLQAVPAMQ